MRYAEEKRNLGLQGLLHVCKSAARDGAQWSLSFVHADFDGEQ